MSNQACIYDSDGSPIQASPPGERDNTGDYAYPGALYVKDLTYRLAPNPTRANTELPLGISFITNTDLPNAIPVLTSLDDGTAPGSNAPLTGALPLFFDRQNGELVIVRGREQAELIPVTAIATGLSTATLATVQNDGNFSSIVMTFSLTDMTDPSDQVFITVRGINGTATYTILTGNIYAADAVFTLRISQQLNAVPGLIANDILPRTFAVDVTAVTAAGANIQCEAIWA